MVLDLYSRYIFAWMLSRKENTALADFTPYQVYTGEHKVIHIRCQQALDKHYARHPERFVKAPPSVAMPPAMVSINPVYDEQGNLDINSDVNFPTLKRVKEKSNLI